MDWSQFLSHLSKIADKKDFIDKGNSGSKPKGKESRPSYPRPRGDKKPTQVDNGNKNPFQYWDEFLKEKYEGGKKKIPNPNPETRGKFQQVAVSTALNFQQGGVYPVYERLKKEYQQWLGSRDGGKSTSKVQPPAQIPPVYSPRTTTPPRPKPQSESTSRSTTSPRPKPQSEPAPKKSPSKPKAPKEFEQKFLKFEHSENRMGDRVADINTYWNSMPNWAKKHFGGDFENDPNVFGRNVSKIAGVLALKGVTVELGESAGVMYIDVDAPDVRDMVRSVRFEDGEVIIHNDILRLNPDAPKGVGTRIFANQVIEAKRAGVSRIECSAARGDSSGWVGYKVWPKMGYDGMIPEISLYNHEIESLLKKHYPNQDDFKVSELLALPGGEELWDKYGSSFDAEFDLNNENQLAVLQSYLDKKAKEEGKTVEEYLKMGRYNSLGQSQN